jgi:hypothetical protein
LYTCPLNDVTSAYADGGLDVPLTWKLILVEWVNDPLVPVAVTLYDPAVAPVQERVDAVDPPLGGVTFDGFKLQVKPEEGDTALVKATAVLNPF